jgi:lysophospholipase L1-like esterase
MRQILLCAWVAAGLMIAAGCAQEKAAPPLIGSLKWIDAWGASFLPTRINGNLQAVPTFNNQTLRLEIFSKLAGSEARVRFTNQFETTPLEIGAAHIALREKDSSIVAGTDRAISFGGDKGVTIAPGEEVWSDPVTLDVPQHADVAISVYVPGERKPTAFHSTGLKTSYLSAQGDFTAAAAIPPAEKEPRTTYLVFFVDDVQVLAAAETKVIVALGDSITNGSASTVDTNSSWPDMLSKRLPALADGTSVSVINMGIGSNRIVTADLAGPCGLKRVDHDVLARPNVTHLIFMEGINDISYEHPKPEQIIAAYKEVIARAHARGIKVYGATLLPIQHSTKDTPDNEATRQAVNKWIRESGAYDAVLDFEKVVRDPANPLRIRSDLTTDYVHPNSAGYKLMAESVDLGLFR